jgi:hypothetical protein
LLSTRQLQSDMNGAVRRATVANSTGGLQFPI